VRAVVYRGPSTVAVEDVPDPRIEAPNDATPGTYDGFGKRADGYTKVLLHPAAA